MADSSVDERPLAGREGGSEPAQAEARPDSPSAVAHEVAKPSPPREPTTVWSWTQRKYRIRSILLLIVNLLLFGGLCVFTHWLHTLKPFQFGWQTYFEPFRFWGGGTQSLNDFLIYPISVDEIPMQGVVIGLLLAAVVAVPIAVSIVYGFASALPFCFLVLLLAHLPWLAVTLVGSCVLAAVKPFRMKFRYGSALVAMIPVLFYLYLATQGGPTSLGASTSPERRLIQTMPWVLAILAACTMLAVIIFVARAVRFRPGAVAPMIALTFIIPVVLFHTQVGIDALTYRLLELEYGPRSKRFEPLQDATPTILTVVQRQAAQGFERSAQGALMRALASADPLREIRDAKRQLTNYVLLQLLRDQQEADRACVAFIADHPTSRYVPSVLFMQARVLDTRLAELRFTSELVQRELYTDFPHVQSEAAWTNLLTQYPHSPLAVAARLRVAQLRLRRGDTVGALVALQATPAATQASAPRATARPLLSTRLPDPTLDFDPEPYQIEGRRLRELILENRDDPYYGVDPLQGLARLDPHLSGYRTELERLAAHYPASPLYDNLVVRWVLAEPNRETRAKQLTGFIENNTTGDALPEALYNLAVIELLASGESGAEQRAAGLRRLKRVAAEHGDTCWGSLAADRLRLAEARTTTQTAEVSVP